MNAKGILAWVVVVIIGLGVVCYLKFGFIPVAVYVDHRYVGVQAPTNHLFEAIYNRVSDKRFEELVKQHPDLVAVPGEIENSMRSSVLSRCAILRRTNYIETLVRNGANVEEATNWLGRHGYADAMILLERVYRESQSPGSMDEEQF